MKQQQGAALVVVMGLLAVGLLVGMASLRSALVDERLAGNYRALVQTQMVEDSLLVALAANAHAAQRDIEFDRLAATLGHGEQAVLQGEMLERLLDVATLRALARRLPLGPEEAGTTSSAGGLALTVQKLDSRRLAVLVGHQIKEATRPRAQLVFMQTDAAPGWQLARFQ
ncbi:hypothetical protein HW452_14365 [Halomonas aquamarina]|uniref:Uncharacterized protein n=1 Tax=Vreelandella aquamarina TaxID=77097 RepID=A0ACC5VX16_9GAMM|nr:PilX N-terminal domain-containing pilus assembly protein [Halomonas aquamarina]MBZ5488708.1 hypothetical protein [Halomonas aquamarina]